MNSDRKENSASSGPRTRPFGILLILVALGGSAVTGLFSLPVRILGMALGGPLVIAGLYLFLGIPPRELFRRYKGFLIAWTVVFAGLLMYSFARAG